MTRTSIVGAVLAAALAAATLTSTARADGDPASDYLVSQNVFFPRHAKTSMKLAQQLAGLALDANQKRYPIKVALIATPNDLGAITALWRKPQRYAGFLAQELSFLYRGRLLIVMPSGFGIHHVGHSTARERRVLAGLTVATTSNGLTRSAITALRRLAASEGVKLSAQRGALPEAKDDHDRLVIIVIASAVLAALAAARLLIARLRRPARARGNGATATRTRR